jgi:serine/threonine protein kinase
MKYLEENDFKPFTLDQEYINKAKKLSQNVLLVEPEGEVNKYILKMMTFRNKTSDNKNLEYFRNRNLLKELRIIKSHSYDIMNECSRYIIDGTKNTIYLVYEYHLHSLESLIKGNNLDFANKLRVLKNLLEAVKQLHTNGILSLDLSAQSVRFTAQEFHMVLCAFGNSIDMSSINDIERNSIMIRSKFNIHTAPECYLRKLEDINWHSDIWALGILLGQLFSEQIFDMKEAELVQYYKQKKIPELFYSEIKNVYIKSIVVGLLRVSPLERPNIFQIIDIYNSLMSHLEQPQVMHIEYAKADVLSTILLILGFTELFNKTTYQILTDDKLTKSQKSLIEENRDEVHPIRTEGSVKQTYKGNNTKNSILIESISDRDRYEN